MNQFGDNPYQSPEPIIRAELVERRPCKPPEKKRRVPFFALFWTVAGPFIWMYGMKYIGVELLNAFGPDDHEVIWFLLGLGGVIWFTTALRSLVWVVRATFAD